MAEKRMFKVSGERLAILGLVIALAFTLAGFSIASAVVNNSDGTVNACYKTVRGQVRINTNGCKPSETAIQLATAPPMYAKVLQNGALIAGKHVTAATRLSTGAYVVTFDRVVTNCAAMVDPITGVSAPVYGLPSTDAVGINTNQVGVLNAVDFGFYVTVTC